MCGGEGTALQSAALELDGDGGGARKEVGWMEDGRGAERLESAGKGTRWWHWRSIGLLQEGNDELLRIVLRY